MLEIRRKQFGDAHSSVTAALLDLTNVLAGPFCCYQLAVQGDWIDREFHVTQAGSDVIFASRSLLSLHDTYGVQIADGFDVSLAIAIVVALEQMELEGRRR